MALEEERIEGEAGRLRRHLVSVRGRGWGRVKVRLELGLGESEG